MNTINLFYTIKQFSLGAVLKVVVLAVVRPPPGGLLLFFNPAGVRCWQGFFIERKSLARNNPPVFMADQLKGIRSEADVNVQSEIIFLK